ncbi:hypothetical protein [Paraburkholderia sp. ZP32-5]|uniref:hypothetical protein n=1 Tax=Paraburkholderia sp. ZP32-5 TaxID=2883245 RepID=UPI001F1AE6E9|nr:hypothetical protein [Paraburkholderia sp. ZP32-5]
MATNITIIEAERRDSRAAPDTVTVASRRLKLPGWLWFIALWCAGVAGAMSLGFAFKLLMNATLFAVR